MLKYVNICSVLYLFIQLAALYLKGLWTVFTLVIGIYNALLLAFIWVITPWLININKSLRCLGRFPCMIFYTWMLSKYLILISIGNQFNSVKNVTVGVSLSFMSRIDFAHMFSWICTFWSITVSYCFPKQQNHNQLLVVWNHSNSIIWPLGANGI